MSRLLLAPGSLWPALAERSRQALASGAMQPIETTEEIVTDAGVDFLVRSLSSLACKEAARKRNEAAPANPFLPHEPELFVADISASHFALLNKFNVIPHHLLIVTRRFVDQESLVDLADFRALAACMAQIDGLAIYNGGEVAGASQPHKHLQLVPLPLVPGGLPVPVESLFTGAAGSSGIQRIPGLPFRHAFAWTEPGWFDDVACAAARLFALYRDLLAAVGLGALTSDAGERQSGPYNLLLTRRWMLLVPRSKESYESVSVNSLGYAGSLFVRDEAQMQVLKRAGPMSVLGVVALSD